MSNPIAQKIANSAVAVSWGGWFVSHIKDINDWLQFIALIVAIVASVCAIRFHTKDK